MSGKTTNSTLDHIMASLNNKHTLKIENDIEKFIKAEAYNHQLRVKDFFEDFDKLRKGWVTEDKFRSGLAKLKIHLTEEQIQSLIQRYINSDGLISYLLFCENVEKQFYNKKEALENLDAVKSKSIYDQHESVLLQSILSYLRKEIKTRRILLKPSLQDFDKINTCHVTYQQFTRALTKLGLNLPDICFKVLARKYMDKNNAREVNYVNFLKDVDDITMGYEENLNQAPNNEFPLMETQVIGGVGNAQKISSVSKSGNDNMEQNRPELGNSQLKTMDNVEALESKLRAEVVMKNLRIHEFFRDVDKLRKGYCKPIMFRRVLELTGIKLPDYQLQMLLDKYTRPDGLVDYSTFLVNIRKILTTKGIQKNPQCKVYQIDSDSTIPARRFYLNMADEEIHRLNYLLRLIKKEIVTRRLLFKPHFQDFDSTKNGYVTRTQFLRVLYQFDIFPAQDYLNVLLKCYTDNGNLNEVNYYAFCRDVDGQDQFTKSINDTHASRFKGPLQKYPPGFRGNPNLTLEEVISRLQKKVKEERIRVYEFFRDFDPLRKGSISNQQFRIGLNMAKLPISNQEFDILTEFYADPDRKGYMRWREFSDHLEEVFTVKNLEKMPNSKLGGSILITKSVRQGMGQNDLLLAQKVMDRFSFFSKATRLYVKQFFQDWDKLGRNKVSPKQFRQVLATVKFNLKDHEAKAICDFFKTEDGYVNYVEFIKATNEMNRIKSNTQNGNGFGDSKLLFESQQIEGVNSMKAAEPLVSSQSQTQKLNYPPSYGYFSDIGVDPNKVLERVKHDVRISRTRLKEYFQDFDPLKKGLITQNKFFGSLDKLKIKLTPNEEEALRRIYMDSDDETKRMEYNRFVSDVDRVFTAKGLQKNPTYRLTDYRLPDFLDPKDILDKQEEERLHTVLVELGEFVRINRILVKPFFKDKDIAKSGKIAFTRFRSILDLCNIKLTEEGYKLICKRFSHQGIEFNYIEFDEVLKKYSDDHFY